MIAIATAVSAALTPIANRAKKKPSSSSGKRYRLNTAKFGQTGPKVGSFDAGYGAGYLAAMVGQKKAREIW